MRSLVNDQVKKKLTVFLLKYGITTLIGLVMVFTVISNYGYAEATETVDKYRILCDAFTIPGVVILMVGALVWISTTGALDGISFLLSGLVKRLMPIGRWREERDEKFYEYTVRKKAERINRGYGFIFVVGGIFMALAAVFMALFYSVYVPTI